MADTTFAATPQSSKTNRTHRQSPMPNPLTFSFTAENTDNHDTLPMDGYGKGRVTIAIDNPRDQIVTVTLYGCHSSTSAVGDADCLQIGSSFTVAATGQGYECCNDPFPFYIVRCTYAVTPNAGTTTGYANFSAY